MAQSNSALMVRIYPNHKQAALLERGCLYRFRYYKMLAVWWNMMHDICCDAYRDFCEKETDKEKQEAFSKTLPWPSKKLTKEGLNDTCLKVAYDKVPKWMKFACAKNFTDIPKKGKEKGIPKNYGDVFRLNAVYLPTVFGERPVAGSVFNWCKEDFAKAVTKTFEKGKKNTHVRFPKRNEADTFKFNIKSLQVKKNNKGNVCKIYVPFLSGDKRKKHGKEIEWIDCSLSDTQLTRVTSASAMTVKKNNAGQWFVSVAVCKETEKHVETGCECGIDLGVKTAATIATNMVGEDSPEHESFSKRDLPIERIKMLEHKIEHLQNVQMRRIKTWVRLHKDDEAKGLKMNTDKNDRAHNAVIVYRERFQSNAYKQTERRIAKLSNDIANIRKDFSEKFSHEIAVKCDKVGLEDLNVKGMTKNKRLSRSIERIGFYKIRTAIERKMGKDNVVYLNRFAPSSQMCSHCGYRNKAVKNLNVREWTCPSCGHRHDRDENAASNIRPSMQPKCLKVLDTKSLST